MTQRQGHAPSSWLWAVQDWTGVRLWDGTHHLLQELRKNLMYRDCGLRLFHVPYLQGKCPILRLRLRSDINHEYARPCYFGFAGFAAREKCRPFLWISDYKDCRTLHYANGLPLTMRNGYLHRNLPWIAVQIDNRNYRWQVLLRLREQ